MSKYPSRSVERRIKAQTESGTPRVDAGIAIFLDRIVEGMNNPDLFATALRELADKMAKLERELAEAKRIMRDLLHDGCSIPDPQAGEPIQYQCNPAEAEAFVADDDK